MPTPTPDEIAEAAATAASDGVASAAQDGRTATAMDPMKQLDVADRIASREAVQGTNCRGGAKSPGRLLRPAKWVPPGAV